MWYSTPVGGAGVWTFGPSTEVCRGLGDNGTGVDAARDASGAEVSVPVGSGCGSAAAAVASGLVGVTVAGGVAVAVASGLSPAGLED